MNDDSVYFQEDLHNLVAEFNIGLPNTVPLDYGASIESGEPVVLEKIPVGAHVMMKAYRAGGIIHARVGAGDDPDEARTEEIDKVIHCCEGGCENCDYILWSAFSDLMAYRLGVFAVTNDHLKTLRFIAEVFADKAIARCEQRAEELA